MSQSKRELRAERKAAREATERAEALAKARRRRWFTLGGLTGVAAAILAIAIAVSASGGANKTTTVTSDAAKLVAGIPEKDGVLGDPNAKITLTEYLDPQCPICAEASKTALPHIINTYVKTGKVKLKAATMSFLGPDSVKAAKFAAGAKAQGKQWAFLETFYASQGQENSGYVTPEFLQQVAQASGVDAGKAAAIAGGASAQAALDQADGAAQALKVDSTPSFTVTRDGGQEKVVAVGLEDLTNKLDKAIS